MSTTNQTWGRKVIAADLAGVMTDDGFPPVVEEYGRIYGANMEALRATKDRLWVQSFSTGGMAEPVFWTTCFDAAGVKLDAGQIAKISAALREAHKPRRGMFEYFAGLKDGGVIRALFTNTAREWLDYFDENLELGRYFDFEFSSSGPIVGYRRKENPDFFRSVLDYLKIGPHDFMFADDQQRNVDVARSVGMGSFLYRSPEQAIAEFERFRVVGSYERRAP